MLKTAVEESEDPFRAEISVLACARDDHSSGTFIAERLTRPTRTAARKRQMPSLFGLAPGGACLAAPVARNAVRSYRTIFNLAAALGGRRCHFCGAIPGVAPAGR